MPSPTIANFFGTNAQILTSDTNVVATAGSPVLVVRYSNFTAEDWTALTAGQETDPEKWLTAIIRKVNTFSVANLDDIPNVVITDPILGLESRTNTLKRRYSYSVDIYQPDTGSTKPDPDLV
jgi:hypothetical protein